MITLNERLKKACSILIENAVFLVKYNPSPLCSAPDEQLQFVTNYLSVRDVKIMLSVCEIYNLKFGINQIPSTDYNHLSVIFREADNG